MPTNRYGVAGFYARLHRFNVVERIRIIRRGRKPASVPSVFDAPALCLLVVGKLNKEIAAVLRRVLWIEQHPE
jgi:hypothetical protein